MELKTHLNSVISSAEQNKADYDANVKALLSDVQVLARILKYTAKEAEDLTIDEIIDCIEPESIEVSNISIEPGMTNLKALNESVDLLENNHANRKLRKVENTQTENTIQNEGTVYFDIRFRFTRQDIDLRIIVNVEAQKSSKTAKLGYHLENRIVYYMSRLISSQKYVEFFGDDYDNLKKVYSIWICVDAKDDEESIEKIHLTSDTVFGKTKDFSQLDKMCGIVIHVRKLENVEESKNNLISMLEDLLANEDVEKKKRKLTEKYNMIMTVNLERGVEQMCNISELVEECGIEKGIALGIEQGIEQGQLLANTKQIHNLLKKNYTLDQISDLLGFELAYVKKIADVEM